MKEIQLTDEQSVRMNGGISAVTLFPCAVGPRRKEKEKASVLLSFISNMSRNNGCLSAHEASILKEQTELQEGGRDHSAPLPPPATENNKHKDT